MTHLLQRWSAGDAGAFEHLFPLVYDELRKIAARQIARERSNHTLQATALVNEAYLRLTDKAKASIETRKQFFRVASQAMRRVLVDHARKHHAEKRPNPKDRSTFEEAFVLGRSAKKEDVLAVHEALSRLEKIHSRQAHIVELRYFVGLSGIETAEVLEVSTATVAREWRVAKLWLKRQLDLGRQE